MMEPKGVGWVSMEGGESADVTSGGYATYYPFRTDSGYIREQNGFARCVSGLRGGTRRRRGQRGFGRSKSVLDSIAEQENGWNGPPNGERRGFFGSLFRGRQAANEERNVFMDSVMNNVEDMTSGYLSEDISGLMSPLIVRSNDFKQKVLAGRQGRTRLPDAARLSSSVSQQASGVAEVAQRMSSSVASRLISSGSMMSGMSEAEPMAERKFMLAVAATNSGAPSNAPVDSRAEVLAEPVATRHPKNPAMMMNQNLLLLDMLSNAVLQKDGLDHNWDVLSDLIASVMRKTGTREGDHVRRDLLLELLRHEAARDRARKHADLASMQSVAGSAGLEDPRSAEPRSRHIQRNPSNDELLSNLSTALSEEVSAESEMVRINVTALKGRKDLPKVNKAALRIVILDELLRYLGEEEHHVREPHKFSKTLEALRALKEAESGSTSGTTTSMGTTTTHTPVDDQRTTEDSFVTTSSILQFQQQLEKEIHQTWPSNSSASHVDNLRKAGGGRRTELEDGSMTSAEIRRLHKRKGYAKLDQLLMDEEVILVSSSSSEEHRRRARTKGQTVEGAERKGGKRGSRMRARVRGGDLSQSRGSAVEQIVMVEYIEEVVNEDEDEEALVEAAEELVDDLEEGTAMHEEMSGDEKEVEVEILEAENGEETEQDDEDDEDDEAQMILAREMERAALREAVEARGLEPKSRSRKKSLGRFPKPEVEEQEEVPVLNGTLSDRSGHSTKQAKVPLEKELHSENSRREYVTPSDSDSDSETDLSVAAAQRAVAEEEEREAADKEAARAAAERAAKAAAAAAAAAAGRPIIRVAGTTTTPTPATTATGTVKMGSWSGVGASSHLTSTERSPYEVHRTLPSASEQAVMKRKGIAPTAPAEWERKSSPYVRNNPNMESYAQQIHLINLLEGGGHRSMLFDAPSRSQSQSRRTSSRTRSTTESSYQHGSISGYTVSGPGSASSSAKRKGRAKAAAFQG